MAPPWVPAAGCAVRHTRQLGSGPGATDLLTRIWTAQAWTRKEMALCLVRGYGRIRTEEATLLLHVQHSSNPHLAFPPPSAPCR